MAHAVRDQKDERASFQGADDRVRARGGDDARPAAPGHRQAAGGKCQKRPVHVVTEAYVCGKRGLCMHVAKEAYSCGERGLFTLAYRRCAWRMGPFTPFTPFTWCRR